MVMNCSSVISCN